MRALTYFIANLTSQATDLALITKSAALYSSKVTLITPIAFVLLHRASKWFSQGLRHFEVSPQPGHCDRLLGPQAVHNGSTSLDEATPVKAVTDTRSQAATCHGKCDRPYAVEIHGRFLSQSLRQVAKRHCHHSSKLLLPLARILSRRCSR